MQYGRYRPVLLNGTFSFGRRAFDGRLLGLASSSQIRDAVSLYQPFEYGWDQSQRSANASEYKGRSDLAAVQLLISLFELRFIDFGFGVLSDSQRKLGLLLIFDAVFKF